MKTCALGLGLAAVVAATASADYSSEAVQDGYWVTDAADFSGTVSVYVVDVYMQSDTIWGGTSGSGDTLLNIYNWNSAGAPGAFFQSFTGTGWQPTNLGGPFDNEALQTADSFVTIGGFGADARQGVGAGAGTGLDPNFGGNGAAAPGAGAGWYNGSPPSFNGGSMVYDNGIQGTLIGRFAYAEEFSLVGVTFEATWNQGLGTDGVQGSFKTHIPSPGAIALLAIGGGLGTRRRRA